VRGRHRVAGVDDVAALETLTFGIGETTRTITSDVLDPTAVPARYCLVQLSGASTSAFIAVGSAYGNYDGGGCGGPWDCGVTGGPTVGNGAKAGGALTAKQAPHRPGTAPALGLRAGMAADAIISQTACFKEQLS
jgi:hypothetical protein